MFSHVTLGTNDLEKTRAFYNAVLPPLGYGNVANKDNASVWSGAGARFVVLTPADGDAATVGNGVTIGFVAPSRAAVNEFHRLALLAGELMPAPLGSVIMGLMSMRRMYATSKDTRSSLAA